MNQPWDFTLHVKSSERCRSSTDFGKQPTINSMDRWIQQQQQQQSPFCEMFRNLKERSLLKASFDIGICLLIEFFWEFIPRHSDPR